MPETPVWNARRIATEIMIAVVAIAAAYGVVELLRYVLDIPSTRTPILAIIAVAVMSARLGFSEWLRRIISGR